MLYDKNFNEVVINNNKPLFFLDVDGVVNALNFEKVWSDSGQQYEWVKIIPDNEENFPLDRSTIIEFNRNHVFGPAIDPKYKKTELRYSSELIARLRKVSQYANIIWLTQWNSEAPRVLNSLFSFEGIPFLHWNTSSDLGQDIKGFELINFVFDNYGTDSNETKRFRVDFSVHNSLAPKIVWVDDIATMKYQNFIRNFSDDIIDSFDSNSLLDRQLGKGERLIIRTDSKYGINKKEMLSIEDFLIGDEENE